MKTQIINVLKSKVSEQVFNYINVFTKSEFNEECGGDWEEVVDRGFDYAITYSDNPNYCLISEGEDIDKLVDEWINELNLNVE